jgi:hypothetical protein
MKFLWKKIRQATAAVTALKDDETGLFVPNRQVSWVISLVLLFGFLTFMTGYFWGQRKAIERFVHKVEEESFADRISYSLYTMNDRDVREFGTPDSESSSDETNGVVENTVKEIIVAPEVKIVQIDNVTQSTVKVESVPKKTEIKKIVEKIFVAPLAGFGTLHAASTFARRVRKHDPYVQVKTRISKTPKGKTIAWYQAVTGEFRDRDDLERVVGEIKKAEHIKDIKIVEKRKVVRT